VTGVARLVHTFYDELWNAWDDAPVPDTLHPELRFRGSLGQETHGLHEWRAYRDGVRRGSPDFHNDVVDLVDHDDRAAARLVWSGTHRGTLFGIAATGRRFSYPGAAFFTVRDGLLAEVFVVGDLLALRTQLADVTG
jgi:predicted ester cyclase